MRAASARARGYADFFGWATDRDLEEWGVVLALSESLKRNDASFFSDLQRRGRPNDPPDCEVLSRDGARIAVEVTELVDGRAIRAFKQGHVYDWAEWSKEKFLTAIDQLLERKDDRFPALKDAPYPGGYLVVIHTDEPMLSRERIAELLRGHLFKKPKYISRAFLILSYDPHVQYYPYFELKFQD